MKGSTNGINKRGINMIKPLNLTLQLHPNSNKQLKQEKSKNEYYMQISPHFETQTLTFTNSIKKVKCIKHEKLDKEVSVSSSISPRTQRSNLNLPKPIQIQQLSNFYNDIKSSRRLKTEQ